MSTMFVARCESIGYDCFYLRCLPDQPQLRLCLQHALQCRHEERRNSVVTSLLEWDLNRWAEFYGAGRAGRSHRNNGQLAFLRFAYTRLEDLAAGAAWETEFDRDVWAFHRLGFNGTRGKLRFDKIPQPGA